MDLGAGWKLIHLTDRCVELRKDDYAYRRYNEGRDGVVRFRGEPGIARDALIAGALALAEANDADLAERMAQQIVPRRPGGYRMQQRQLAHVFGTPEDPEIIGVKRA